MVDSLRSRRTVKWSKFGNRRGVNFATGLRRRALGAVNTAKVAVLGVLGAGLSLIILLAPKKTGTGDESLGDIDLQKWREYKVGQALGLIASMVLYALLLRPIGFVGATTLFLAGTGWILGERKLPKMFGIAFFGAFVVWYLVQETLGIFLRPWPWFISGG